MKVPAGRQAGDPNWLSADCELRTSHLQGVQQTEPEPSCWHPPQEGHVGPTHPEEYPQAAEVVPDQWAFWWPEPQKPGPSAQGTPAGRGTLCWAGGMGQLEARSRHRSRLNPRRGKQKKAANQHARAVEYSQSEPVISKSLLSNNGIPTASSYAGGGDGVFSVHAGGGFRA